MSYHSTSEKQHIAITFFIYAEHDSPDDLMGTMGIEANAPHIWEGSGHEDIHSLGHKLAIHITNVDWHFSCRKGQLLLCSRIEQQELEPHVCKPLPILGGETAEPIAVTLANMLM